MSTTATATFAESLAELGVDSREVPATAVTDTVEELLTLPAVGVPIDIEGVTLPQSVECDLDRSTVEAAATGITPVECAIADYGSIVIESGTGWIEPVSLFADTHVAVVRKSDILSDMPEAIDHLSAEIPEDRRSRIIATGPSATADMGELVYGAHGPQTVQIVVVSDR